MTDAAEVVAKAEGRLWWQDGVIYQVYPRSFQDSDGDGVGDLSGILARLDYLVELGVKAVWVSPFYPSPMADFGYDVADYCGVDPIFGTLEDFDRLVEGIHRRGLKLILDFVPNHSSDRHPWFLESRSSRDNPKRDWYLWRDGVAGAGGTMRPPNNWMSHFGGPAWTFDERTGQFYCHSFLARQPDLNWWNPEVREAIYGAMRFWLDRGADGFRMDVLWLLIKDEQFRDNPVNPDWREGGSSFGSVLSLYTADRPEVQEIVREMRTVLNAYPERLLIGEIYLPLERLVMYYGDGGGGADLPFNFRLIQTEWNAGRVAELIREYEGLLTAIPKAWPNWVLGNHDQKRLATRIGPAQARVAAMLLLTLRGTPTLYYGDELGMRDGVIAPDQVQDPAEKNEPGIGAGRDPERTPMLWEEGPGAGFTTGRPWLPIGEDRAGRSVEAQRREPASLLALYRRLLGLRREREALHAGSVEEVREEAGVLRYVRRLGEQRLEILLNFTGEARRISVGPGRFVLSSCLDAEGANIAGEVVLRRSEGMVRALR